MTGIEIHTLRGPAELTVRTNTVGPYIHIQGETFELLLSPKQAIVLASEIRSLLHDATDAGLRQVAVTPPPSEIDERLSGRLRQAAIGLARVAGAAS